MNKIVFTNLIIYFLEYTHFLDGIGVKRLNSGIGIDIKDFATNNCFFVLDLTPEQCNNTHLHGESKISFLYLISNLVFTLI